MDASETIQKLDELIGECRDLTAAVRGAVPGNGGSASVKIGGNNLMVGALIGICIATCAATWIALIIGAMELHDLRAWRDIDHAKITKLEAGK